MASVMDPSRQRCVRVRLADVPLDERLLAARVAVSVEPDPWVRLRIRVLALNPGDLTAWVRP
jgi:hypothetical protein